MYVQKMLISMILLRPFVFSSPSACAFPSNSPTFFLKLPLLGSDDAIADLH
jgi:hypothetical protein